MGMQRRHWDGKIFGTLSLCFQLFDLVESVWFNLMHPCSVGIKVMADIMMIWDAPSPQTSQSRAKTHVVKSAVHGNDTHVLPGQAPRSLRPPSRVPEPQYRCSLNFGTQMPGNETMLTAHVIRLLRATYRCQNSHLCMTDSKQFKPIGKSSVAPCSHVQAQPWLAAYLPFLPGLVRGCVLLSNSVSALPALLSRKALPVCLQCVPPTAACAGRL